MAATSDRLDRIERALEALTAEHERRQRELAEEQQRRQREDERRQREDERRQREEERSRRKREEEFRRLQREVGKVSSAVGYFAEAIIAPSTPRVLRKVGIRASGYRQRVSERLNGEAMEIDVVAVGHRARSGVPVVAAIEVSEQLKDPEVTRALEKFADFFRFFPEYRPYELVGGVAGMRVVPDAALRAEREGLLVLGPDDDMARLLNRPGFRPKVWRFEEPARNVR